MSENLRFQSYYTSVIVKSTPIDQSENKIFFYRCSVGILKWIPYEPIWKQCYFRLHFQANINEPSVYIIYTK